MLGNFYPGGGPFDETNPDALKGIGSLIPGTNLPGFPTPSNELSTGLISTNPVASKPKDIFENSFQKIQTNGGIANIPTTLNSPTSLLNSPTSTPLTPQQTSLAAPPQDNSFKLFGEQITGFGDRISKLEDGIAQLLQQGTPVTSSNNNNYSSPFGSGSSQSSYGYSPYSMLMGGSDSFFGYR